MRVLFTFMGSSNNIANQGQSTQRRPDLSEVRRRPTQERSRKRFEAIVQAASTLIATRGLESITMTDIAHEADMESTAVYRYFPNKGAIVRELAIRTFEVDEAITSGFTTTDQTDPEALLRAGIQAYCKAHLHNPLDQQIKAAVHADAELSALDLEDSRWHAAGIAAALAQLTKSPHIEELTRRALLLVELMDGAVRLASRVEPNEVDAIIEEFTATTVWMMLRPT